jgi:hypothetical protein
LAVVSLAAADTGIDEDGVMAGVQEIGLYRQDNPTGLRIERLGLEPMAVGFDRLGQGLVEEFQRPNIGCFQLENAVDGDIT